MNLLAATGGWVLDIVFFVVLLVGMGIGTWRGFIKGVCKLAGTIFALGFAVCFCVPMENSLEKSFGMTTALSNAVGNATAGGWIAVAISFVILVVIIKLGTALIGWAGSALTDRFGALKLIDRFLGGLLGLIQAFVVILLLLAICNWIHLDSINAFIETSAIVKHLYSWDWFSWAMSFPTAK